MKGKTVTPQKPPQNQQPQIWFSLYYIIQNKLHKVQESEVQLLQHYLSQGSWANIFRRLFLKRWTFGLKSSTKSLVSQYQAKFAKIVPDDLKDRHIWLITFKNKLMFSYIFIHIHTRSSIVSFQWWIFTYSR